MNAPPIRQGSPPIVVSGARTNSAPGNGGLPQSGPNRGPRVIDRSASPAPVNPPVRADMVNYGVVDALKGVDLLRGLGKITSKTHTPRRYSEASDELFARVGHVAGDNKVVDIYTGRALGPVTERESAWKHQLSVEHTWPRSLGAKNYAESDLHHLFAADKTANGRRGTFPYGEVKTAVEYTTPAANPGQSRLGKDSAGNLVFEPDAAVKGDIARGLLYFATRYQAGKQKKISGENFQTELPVLLRWHKDDPVSDIERTRNNSVAAFQGNRNPYIDRPDLVDRIGLDGFRKFREATPVK